MENDITNVNGLDSVNNVWTYVYIYFTVNIYNTN